MSIQNLIQKDLILEEIKNALKQYDDTDDETLKENILFDLGQAALREEESWFVLHRNTIPGKNPRVWRRYI